MDPQQPEATQAAQTRIGELQRDSAWTRSYLDGDQAKVQEMATLHATAFPEAAATGNLPAGEGIAKAAEAATQPLDEGMIGEPPGGSWEYEFSFAAPGTGDEMLAHESKLKQDLFDEGVPRALVSIAEGFIVRGERSGATNNDAMLASMKTVCEAELQKRHGAGAAAVIADASRLFNRLDARNPLVGDLLVNSGATCEIEFIETLARFERGYFAKRAK